MFLANHRSVVPVPLKLPPNWLPPVRGTMLISEPPVSDSPNAPETLMFTSCALATSAVYPPV